MGVYVCWCNGERERETVVVGVLTSENVAALKTFWPPEQGHIVC